MIEGVFEVTEGSDMLEIKVIVASQRLREDHLCVFSRLFNENQSSLEQLKNCGIAAPWKPVFQKKVRWREH